MRHRYVKLILLYRYGRLGNQLFQIAACNKVNPNVIILGVDLDDLGGNFHCRGLLDVSDGALVRLLNILLRKLGRGRLLQMCRKARIFTLIEEVNDAISVTPGIIRWIGVVDGFFQQEKTACGVYPPLTVINHQRPAEKQWRNLGSVQNVETTAFVHVRRGGYLHWPSSDYPAVLSGNWYKDQMSRLSEQCNIRQFLVCSDDTSYCERLFKGLENITLSRGSVAEDFWKMTNCQAGILSASSLSWWAAYLVANNQDEPLLLAPRYWAGWGKSAWFPAGIETSFLTYVDAY